MSLFSIFTFKKKLAQRSWIPLHTWIHQSSGLCSAHPFCSAKIDIPFWGCFTKPMHFPECISTKETLIEELPISIPK